jgi:hypothetical protein
MYVCMRLCVFFFFLLSNSLEYIPSWETKLSQVVHYLPSSLWPQEPASGLCTSQETTNSRNGSGWSVSVYGFVHWPNVAQYTVRPWRPRKDGLVQTFEPVRRKCSCHIPARFELGGILCQEYKSRSVNYNDNYQTGTCIVGHESWCFRRRGNIRQVLISYVSPKTAHPQWGTSLQLDSGSGPFQFLTHAIEVRVPVGSRISLLHMVQTGSGAHPARRSNGYGGVTSN